MTRENFSSEDKNNVQLGQEALEKGNVLLALEIFAGAYQEKQTFYLNRRIVALLDETGDFQEALQYAEEWAEKYLTSLNYFPLYFRLLVKNQLYIQARIALVYWKKKIPAEEGQCIQELADQLQMAEDFAETFESADRIRRLNAFEGINALPAFQQIALVKEMGRLTIKEFTAMAKEMLAEKDLNYFARSSIAEELVKLDAEESFDFLWFSGEVKTFVPAQTFLPGKNLLYQKVLAELTRRLEDDDPSLLENLKEEARVHFAVLFPFAEDYVTSPEEWGEACIESATGNAKAAHPETNKKISLLQAFILSQTLH